MSQERKIFAEIVQKRRSVRRFLEKPYPEEWIQEALELAVLAPNSSNVQTWDFFWVQTEDKKKSMIEACLNQSAARTASDLIVVTADFTNWKRSHEYLLSWIHAAQAPKPVLDYYQKLIPILYQYSGFFLAKAKSCLAFLSSIKKPTPRGPFSKRDLQEVAIKSAALASENFVLAITAQGGATCMMEGFDEGRVQKILGLSAPSKVVMVIAVGWASEKGTWGPQMRIPLEKVFHKV